jgi:hypothetical protein
VAGAELPLLIPFVAGPHAGQATLHFGPVGKRIDQIADRDRLVRNRILGIGHIDFRPLFYSVSIVTASAIVIITVIGLRRPREVTR